MLNTPDSIFKNDYKMLTIRQLNTSIDSLTKLKDSFGRRVQLEVAGQFHYQHLPDSNWKKSAPIKKSIQSFSDLIPDSAKYIVYDNSINIVNNLKSTFQFTGVDWDNRKRDLRNNQIEWHRKFSLSLACLVLFFIGAPLGSIIRKGGLGMPLVVAIIFFLLFHLLNMFGEKFVKDEIVSPLIGMWLSILVLAPLGALLTYKALHDSQLFNKELYFRFLKSFKGFIKTFVNKIILGKKNTLNL
jgi:lipopolysaccharide export system permease protein